MYEETEGNEMDILERIKELYPRLTKKQKGIADYLISNPEDMCYITLAQLSQNTDASELTLLRFCQKIGCENFLELKSRFREYTQHMIKVASSPSYFAMERVSGSESERVNLLRGISEQEAIAANEFFATVDYEEVIAAADEIKKSKCIYIFAHDISKIPGVFLESRLRLLYFDAELVDLSSLAETQRRLEHLTEGDLAIFFSFPKYFYPMGSIVKKVQETGTPIVTVTNSMASPAAKYSKHILLCPTTTRAFYNTLTLPMAMLNLLVSCLAIDMVPQAEWQDYVDALPS